MNCAVSIEPELCAGADELPEEEKVALEGLEQEIGVVDLCVTARHQGSSADFS